MPLRDTLALLLIVFTASPRHLQTPSQTAEPPTADVTFYTSSEPSNIVKGWLPGYKHGPFAGGIFDGEHLLAQIQPRRFVTFTLPPGPHVFSASVEGWHPDKNSLLQINLVSNRSYFLRIDQESLAPPVV